MHRLFVATPLQTLALAFLLCAAAHPQVHAQGSQAELIFQDYSLYVDGASVIERAGSFGGRVIWFSLPQQGQFIISTEPQEGYRFEKIAKVEGQAVSFSVGGKFYQFTSTAAILSEGGELEVWVLHEADFEPQGCGKGLCAGAASSWATFLEHRKRKAER